MRPLVPRVGPAWLRLPRSCAVCCSLRLTVLCRPLPRLPILPSNGPVRIQRRAEGYARRDAAPALQQLLLLLGSCRCYREQQLAAAPVQLRHSCLLPARFVRLLDQACVRTSPLQKSHAAASNDIAT